MISKEEFEEAKKIIENYKIQVNKSSVPYYTCICCKNNKIELSSNEDLNKLAKQEQAMWTDGSVNKISFGYGSRNDMRSFYIGICDTCIDKLEKDNLAIDVKHSIRLQKESGI